jgi:hypothetical protein
MSRTTKLLTLSTAALAPWLLTSAIVNAQDSDSFAGTAAISVGGQKLSSFDISFVDPTISLYVLGDRTNNAIDLVDTNTNAFQGFCGKGLFTGATGNNDTSGPDGVLIRDGKEIWAGDGNSTVKVFNVADCLANPETAKPVHTIITGSSLDKRADEMCYDPADDLIMVANNAADPPFATLISTTTYSPVKKISFPQSTNGAEQCQWNPRTKKFYITIPGTDPSGTHGQVVVINPDGTVDTIFSIPPGQCSTPQGMAVGPNHDILVGCNGNDSAKHSSVIIDDQTGKILATVANESGPDEVWFNPGNNHYFLARSGSPAQVRQALGIIDAETRVADTSIDVGPVNNPPTSPHPNAHSVAADSVTNKTFFPIPGGLSTLCSLASGGSVSDANGCILVVTGKNDADDSNACVAEGAPVIAVDGGNPTFMRSSCR